jgi:hypothetical protein
MLIDPNVGMMSATMSPDDHLADGLQVEPARRTHTHAVRRAAAVGDDVEAEFAVARFREAVDVAAGGLMPSITSLKWAMVPSMVV